VLLSPAVRLALCCSRVVHFTTVEQSLRKQNKKLRHLCYAIRLNQLPALADFGRQYERVWPVESTRLPAVKSSDVIQAYTYLSKKTHLTLFLCRSSCRKSRRKFCTDSNVMCPQMTICLHATYTHETVHWQRGMLPRTDRASAFLSQNFWPGLRTCRTTMWKFSFHTVDRWNGKTDRVSCYVAH